MIIRLTATQIAQFWDVIKYSLTQVERIGEEKTQEEFNQVFASLMADKAQCFLKYTEDGSKITAVMITEILEHRITKKMSLRIRSLYAFSPFDPKEWTEGFGIIMRMAKREGCKDILFDSTNRKIIDMAKSVGFSKLTTTMNFSIGD